MTGKRLCCEDRINMRNQVCNSMCGLVEHSSDNRFSMDFGNVCANDRKTKRVE